MKKGNLMDKMIKGAIHDAVAEALKAKPVKVHLGGGSFQTNFFEIGGEIYSGEAAIEKILGQYSWYNEK